MDNCINWHLAENRKTLDKVINLNSFVFVSHCSLSKIKERKSIFKV